MESANIFNKAKCSDMKWSLFKSILTLNILKYLPIWLVIVPVCVKSFEKISNSVHLTIFEHSFEINIELPFSFKLLYFGALFLTLAQAVYKTRCPELIQRTDSFSDIADDCWGEEHYREFLAPLNLGKKGFADFQKEYGSHGMFQGASAYWVCRRKLDLCRNREKWAIALFIVISFLAIGFVFLQNIYTVFPNYLPDLFRV